MIETSASASSFVSAARTNFEALLTDYRSNDAPGGQAMSFWKLGNSFDTMIDFLDTIDDSSAHDVALMAAAQLDASLKHINGGYDGAWFDDFGWWCAATSRAVQRPYFKQDLKSLENILTQCWSRFTANAPYVWERHAPGTFEDYAPAVEGGVWNAYWTGTSDKYPGPKDGDPSNGNLTGIQNTVTNSLYLMAANRLRRSYPGAGEAAKMELQFLLTWLNEKENSLWRPLDGSGTAGIIRERVGHFKNGKRAPSFQDLWAWTGDQGLMLGDLSDAMLELPPGFRGPALARLQDLLVGVCRALVDSNGVLLCYTAEGTVPNNDTSDYQVGPGVFWRNVLHVWETNSELHPAMARSEFQRMLHASANAAANAPTTGASIESLTNQTAVLVTAAKMLA